MMACVWRSRGAGRVGRAGSGGEQRRGVVQLNRGEKRVERVETEKWEGEARWGERGRLQSGENRLYDIVRIQQGDPNMHPPGGVNSDDGDAKEVALHYCSSGLVTFI